MPPMSLITSNTIVRDGMPFIGKVLEQVAPLVDKMVITLSEKSNDGTKDKILNILASYPEKIVLLYENVASRSLLTAERNRQLEYSNYEWVMLLDDDDYWEREQLEKCIAELPKDPKILACAVNPYQLLDKETHNNFWKRKWFSKFLRKTPRLHFIHPFPRDLPASDNEILYHKTSKNVIFLPYKFYHLSELKSNSFRKLGDWSKEFDNRDNLRPKKLPKPVDFL